MKWEVRYNFALMEQLGASVTIAANLKNTIFPYHVEPEYEITGGFVDGMGGIMSAAFAPFVTVNQRTEWENFANTEQGWVERSHYLKEIHPIHRDALHGTIQDHEHDRRRRQLHIHHDQQEEKPKETIFPTIFQGWDENGDKIPEINEPGKVFAPLWQVSPASYDPVNANLLADPRIAEAYQAMIQANSTIMSKPTEIGPLVCFSLFALLVLHECCICPLLMRNIPLYFPLLFFAFMMYSTV